MSIQHRFVSLTSTLVVLIAVMGVAALAGQVTVPHTFTAGTIASATEVNENFTALADEINDNDDRIEFLEDRSGGGFIDAAVYVNSSGSVVQQFWNIHPIQPAITSTFIIPGATRIDFGLSVTGRYFQATLANVTPGGTIKAGTIAVVPVLGEPTQVEVHVWGLDGAHLDHGFYLTVH